MSIGETRNDVRCPVCGSPMIERAGKYGDFLGCSMYRQTGCRGNRQMNNSSVAPHTQTSPYMLRSGQLQSECDSFKPTDEQRSIISAMIESNDHLLVYAGPGCGKSTTSMKGITFIKNKYPNLSIQYACFNAAIRDDFAPRVNVNINGVSHKLASVASMHQLGRRAIANSVQMPVELNINKTADIMQGIFSYVDWENKQLVDATDEIVSHCKNHLFEGTNEQIRILCDKFGIINYPSLATYVPEIMRRSLDYSRMGKFIIDFDDMIWIPVVKRLAFPHNDILIVDEAQDLNPTQHALMMMVCGKGRMVVVGDPAQAIYGFRGADSHSMKTLQCMLGTTDRQVSQLPLHTTQRCSKAIVEDLNKRFPMFPLHAKEGAPDGNVGTIYSKDFPAHVNHGDMVLCRVNAPIISWAFRLLRVNKRVIIQGRDFGAQLVKFVEKLKARSIPDFRKKIGKWRNVEIDRIKKAARVGGRDPNPMLIESVNDKYDAMIAIADECKNVDEIVSKIKYLFDVDKTRSNEDCIKLSSIHRAKGLEANRVYLLHPELLPHPMARTVEDIEQEKNCEWVARSRAKNEHYDVIGSMQEKPAPSPSEQIAPGDKPTTVQKGIAPESPSVSSNAMMEGSGMQVKPAPRKPRKPRKATK
jgi:ssDNA-binding Zn-finger/Zn-ribbon topoisomerase 1